MANPPSGDSPEGRQPEVPEPAKVEGDLVIFIITHISTQVAVEVKPLSLAEEDLLSDLTYDELKRAFR